MFSPDERARRRTSKWPEFCIILARNQAIAQRGAYRALGERHPPGRRWISGMNKDYGSFGLVIGAIVAVAAALFIFTGGELGGKKTVEGDQDLPPIAAVDK
jgi:hypothetical protein